MGYATCKHDQIFTEKVVNRKTRSYEETIELCKAQGLKNINIKKLRRGNFQKFKPGLLWTGAVRYNKTHFENSKRLFEISNSYLCDHQHWINTFESVVMTFKNNGYYAVRIISVSKVIDF